MAVTKTELTARLEPAKRQFHQWFYREFDSIRQIKDYPRLYAASPTTTSKPMKANGRTANVNGTRNGSTMVADEHVDKGEAPHQKMEYWSGIERGGL
ncbi:hypothetical protein OEA41_009576 [Lepraria neglecta]|uniref:Uncharacterized protein n=1 Tax=Lepraria neglecta TaxID=209136 RepID=A0AAD9Z2J5_9LECA|nr:hypothetical protein OEA41_009576 [Lepraria neglecta]